MIDHKKGISQTTYSSVLDGQQLINIPEYNTSVESQGINHQPQMSESLSICQRISQKPLCEDFDQQHKVSYSQSTL